MLRSTFIAAVVLWSLSLHSESNTSIFGGGPFYHEAERVVPLVKVSGFKTVILWTLHIRQNGDLVFNDNLIISNGRYVGDSNWPAQIAQLKSKDSSVKRVEFSVGSWGVPDFEMIEFLIAKQGINESSILYRNFAALKATLPMLDAINFDDETSYSPQPSFFFSMMLSGLGYHVTLSPYTHIQFWSELFFAANSIVPGLIDAVYLQGYAGGTGVNPAFWNRFFPALKVQLGLWSKNGVGCTNGKTPSDMANYFQKHRDSLDGGWVWLLDDVLKCTEYGLSDYALAIDEALTNP